MPWTTAIVIVLIALAAPASAEVFTWIDRQGVAHFSDYPPGELPHQQLSLPRPSTVPMSENLQQERRISGIRDEVRDLLAKPGRAQGRGQRAEEADRARVCDGYRDKLARIQSKLRAGYGNDKGNSLRRQRRITSQKLSRECILR